MRNTKISDIVKIVDIRTIKPYANNPRKNENAVEPVANSIREFGFRQPIVVDADNTIIAGHTRLEAAKQLGLAEVPVIVTDDLTPEQVKAYRLADNKTGELAGWDFELLDLELEELGDIADFDMGDFGFEMFPAPANGADFFQREERDGAARQEDNDEYNEFLDKFEPKKTTDDCYTPDLIYDAVAKWVENEYGVGRDCFVRPFYPGGDYERYKYPPGCVVVDNPPFSILSEIVRFYTGKRIRFFLFAPGLMLFNSATQHCCAVCVGAQVTYENGANVCTSFLTNLEAPGVHSAPDLYAAIREANEANLAAQKKSVPKYEYPAEVLTAAQLNRFSKYGVGFRASATEIVRIDALDAQKEFGKAIYGDGYLLSRGKAAEKAAAEKAAAQVWRLSDRERAIVESLG